MRSLANLLRALVNAICLAVVLTLPLAACAPAQASVVAATQAAGEADLGPPAQGAQLVEALERIAIARATQGPQETKTQLALATQQGSVEQTATSEAHGQATLQAQAAMPVLQELRDSGDIHTSDGEYHALPDFDASWARINQYDFLLTEFAPADFVIKADIEWDSASPRANWANSGCGYVFHLNARGDHYLAFLGLDGFFYLYRNLEDTIERLGRWYYGELSKPRGGAELLLVAEGARQTFFVDGQRIHSIEENTLSSGYLGYALVSGTNKGFGIRCTMSDVQLWILNPD